MLVEIDLGLNAHQNGRKYYDRRRVAGDKRHKTLAAAKKALKSAEKKTQETLKQVCSMSHLRIVPRNQTCLLEILR